ncbi:MAG: hypothetical protein LUF87_02870 [Alistipes sp.]|nr:hypothetical protein [Alistipes sp.]
MTFLVSPNNAFSHNCKHFPVIANAVKQSRSEEPDVFGTDYGMFDRTYEIDGHRFRVRRLPYPDFLRLYESRTESINPREGVSGREEINRVLDGYQLVDDTVSGLRFRIEKDG